MLPISARAALEADVTATMASVCSAQQGAMHHAPAIETDFAGSFVENGIPALHADFNGRLTPHGITVSIRAVYIHQSPMVEIAGSKPRNFPRRKCELGDILIVQSHKRHQKKTYWRAALWQLKRTNGGLQTPEDPQFWLYETWPLFEVYRGHLAPGLRDFEADVRSGYYGLVSNSGWTIAPPVSPIGPSVPFALNAGKFLVEMMFAVDPAQAGRNDQIGRRVFTRPKPSPSLNWSQTIWEVLKITGAKSFAAKNLYSDRQPRLRLLYDTSIPPFDPRPHSGPPDQTVTDLGELERGLIVIVISTDASEFSSKREEVMED